MLDNLPRWWVHYWGSSFTMGSSRSGSFSVCAQRSTPTQVQRQQKGFRRNTSAKKTSYKAQTRLAQAPLTPKVSVRWALGAERNLLKGDDWETPLVSPWHHPEPLLTGESLSLWALGESWHLNAHSCIHSLCPVGTLSRTSPFASLPSRKTRHCL